MKEPRVYIAMICDIKGSRSLENWASVYDAITGGLKDLNKTYKPSIHIPFKFTVGDEFQGVVRNPSGVCEIINFLKTRLPVQFYCGIGVGEVERIKKGSTAMRGSAFYNARKALDECKRKKRSFYALTGTENLDRAINSLFYFIETIESSWTKRQKEVIHYLRKNPELTLERLAQEFNVSKQNISKILKASKYRAVTEGEEGLCALFELSTKISLLK